MNEIKLINVGGVDQNIKDQYVRDIIAPSENGLDSSTGLPVSSRHYDEGDYLIAQNRKYYEAITDIDVGDTLVVGTNIRATTVTEEILMLKGQSANVAIETIADMETAATASKDFATGKYVYWNYGVDYGMYEVIADIAEGDAFVTTGVSQNIELANKIGDDVSYLKKELAKVSNPNLLDNPWFTVNQRGLTSYIASVNGRYGIDRWKCTNTNSGSIQEVFSDGIQLTNGTSGTAWQHFFERDFIEKLKGKEITFSAIVKFISGDDENAASGIDIVYSTNSDPTNYIYPTEWNAYTTDTYNFNLLKITITVPNDTYDIIFRIRNYGAGTKGYFKAAKLELGSRSTLANDVAPNYAEELAKCQRYYFRYNNSRAAAPGLGFGIKETSNNFAILQLPVAMRDIAPSITLNKVKVVLYDGNAYNIDGVSSVRLSGNAVSFRFSIENPPTSIPTGSLMEIYFQSSNDAYLDVSADL